MTELTREAALGNGHGEVEADAPQNTSPGVSIFESLREEVQVRASDEHLLLPLPGWNGKLLGRYVVIEREQLTPLVGRAQRAGASALSQDADLDFLARALDCLYVLDDEDKRIRLDDASGEPIRYDTRLGALLPNAPKELGSRGVIRALFNDNALALGGHVMKVVSWMQDTSARVEGAVVEGE